MKPRYLPITSQKDKKPEVFVRANGTPGIAFKLAQQEKSPIKAICAGCKEPLTQLYTQINMHSSCKQKFLREHETKL